MAEYKSGNILKGQVTGIEKYGAFVNVDEEYVGLIHISEVSNDFVKDINDFLEVGQTIYCQILEVDEETKKIKLSIKNINYKVNNQSKIKESRLGFLPLRNHLDKWVSDRISEIEKNNSK